MPFDSDIYFIDFVLSFFSLCLSRFGIFSFRNCAGFNWNFAFHLP